MRIVEPRSPMPPIPAQGPSRLAWLESLDATVTADARSTAERLAGQGWPPAAIEAVVGDYRHWLSSRVAAAVDLAAIELSWAAA